MNDPYENHNPYEKNHAAYKLFQRHEIEQLQYMTMVPPDALDVERGVVSTRPMWESEPSAPVTEPRSSTTTPNDSRVDLKKPAVKMSIADYKNMKVTGVKPPPRPAAATPDSRVRYDGPERPGHQRNASNVSESTPMARVSSLEGPGEHRKNGASAAVHARPEQRPAAKESDRYVGVLSLFQR